LKAGAEFHAIKRAGYRFGLLPRHIFAVLSEQRIFAVQTEHSARSRHVHPPPVRDERSKKLMAAIDAVNGKYGRGVLSLAAVGTGKSGAMRAERLSQRYTTRWDELPVVE
jgi:hypothetical protein